MKPLKFPCRRQNHCTQPNTSDSKRMVSTESFANHIYAKLDNPGTPRQLPTMKTITMKTLSIQTLVQHQHLKRCLFDASTAANNDISMVLTTDGSVRIATVPEKLDLAQANTEIVDTQMFNQRLNGQLQNELTICWRAHDAHNP